MKIFLAWILLGAAWLPASFLQAQTTAAGIEKQGVGAIQGTAVDTAGQPVPGATVEIVTASHPAKAIRKLGNADASGHFSISPIAWGTYQVYAIAQRAGAMYTTWSFARDEPGVSVTISPDVPEGQVVVKVGLEPARLAPIAAVDAVTGKPITVTDPVSGRQLSPVTISLTRFDKNSKPERGVSTNAPVLSTNTDTLEVLIPAEVPVIAKVQAPGYADWYYPGTQDQSLAKPIVLKPGESFSLGNVLLSPLSNR
jgi:hypothetical protein